MSQQVTQTAVGTNNASTEMGVDQGTSTYGDVSLHTQPQLPNGARPKRTPKPPIPPPYAKYETVKVRNMPDIYENETYGLSNGRKPGKAGDSDMPVNGLEAGYANMLEELKGKI